MARALDHFQRLRESFVKLLVSKFFTKNQLELSMEEIINFTSRTSTLSSESDVSETLNLTHSYTRRWRDSGGALSKILGKSINNFRRVELCVVCAFILPLFFLRTPTHPLVTKNNFQSAHRSDKSCFLYVVVRSSLISDFSEKKHTQNVVRVANVVQFTLMMLLLAAFMKNSFSLLNIYVVTPMLLEEWRPITVFSWEV